MIKKNFPNHPLGGTEILREVGFNNLFCERK